jgi:hypothetical protein
VYSSQVPYYELHEAILKYRGEDVFCEVLLRWLTEHVEERRWLDGFASPTGDHWSEANGEDLGRLYAASRVNDVLLLRFQPSPPSLAEPPPARWEAMATKVHSPRWEGPQISLDQYIEFATGLGFRVVKEQSFNPFFHEIVSVESAGDPEQQAEVLAELWPCLMLGDLLFSRAGCAVRGGANQLNPEVAQRSVLHWAYRRRHRPVTDRSVGWGHNSQWRTSFRRDYWHRGAFHFNVDGRLDASEADVGTREPNPSREELEPAERVELVVNRCFVRTRKADTDLWPWDDRHVVSSKPA